MIENVLVGNKYQNIKTDNIYRVVGIAKNSENPTQLLVIYEQENAFVFELWARPLELFKEKFREVG